MLEGFIEYGYIGLFLACFLAATVLPLGSEVVYSSLLIMGFPALWCTIIATLGNWLGGMTGYYLGRLGKIEWIEKYLKIDKLTIDKYHKKLESRGAFFAFFSFLPIVGDFIPIVLGIMRANVIIVNISMLLGKLIRYLLILYALGFLVELG